MIRQFVKMVLEGNMQLYREIKKINKKQLIINLPADFVQETVEIIIFPVETKTVRQSTSKLSLNCYDLKGAFDNTNLRDFAHEE